MKEHFYGISLGSGKTLGHAGFCGKCGTQIAMDATAYSSLAKQPGDNVEILAKQTFPYLRQARAERLALEEKLRAGRLTPWEREQLLLEPFAIVSELFEAKFGGGAMHIQGRGAWAILGGFAAAFGIVIAANQLWFPSEHRDKALTAAGIIVLAGCLYFLIQLFFEPRRIYTREFLPSLAKALRPLKPTKEEITMCLERYKRAGMQIGKKIKPAELWEAVQPPRPSSFVAPDLRK